MLGISKKKVMVEFSAHGKHPAFNDYFNLNTGSPLANALSGWVEKGAKLGGTSRKNEKIRSFRFWVRGMNKGELGIGIVRDSSDSLGRTYPLIIMAQGSGRDWEKRWPYVFNHFDSVFRAFEEMTAARYDSFKAFETRLAKTSFSAFLSVTEDDRSELPETMMAWFRQGRDKGALAMPVATFLKKASSYPRPIRQGLFKKRVQPPGAVFLGGLPENPLVAIYARPLTAKDFHTVFTLSNGNEHHTDDQTQKGEEGDGY